MDFFPEDLWAMILARLPIKIFTDFKLVCKQWKLILESPYFRDLFISVHQNSASSSWSLIYGYITELEMVAQYQCDIWGLERSLHSYIKSFLTEKSYKDKNRKARVEAYSDAGLILIHAEYTVSHYYVANPISRECIEIFLDPLKKVFETHICLWQWGLVTRTESGVVLGYKVVLTNKLLMDTKLSCLIYSSETGMCSLEIFNLPSFFINCSFQKPISLNGSLYWLAINNDHYDAVLSIDFYDGSTRCRFTPFPDLENTIKFERVCTPCQGFLMYMNIICENKLCLWRLQREGWQKLSEISPDFILTDYLPLTINPFDAKTAYFWSVKQEDLLYINLHNGKFVNQSQFQRSGHGHINDPRAMISLKCFKRTNFTLFLLPQWLYRIPYTPGRV